MRKRMSQDFVASVSLATVVVWLAAAPGLAQVFSDQTELGVAFEHMADVEDELAMGAGGAWGDYDDDGDLDLYVATRIGANALFENLDGAAFVDVAAAFGVEAVAAESTGALWGDYDNDGDQDLYVMNRGANIMFRNDGSDGAGGWIFTDVTAMLGVGSEGRTAAAVWGDYDNDGWLDLYVANHYFPFYKPVPGGDELSADALYHNEDDGQGGRVFVDVAPELFGTDVLYESIAHAAGFLDYDNDGDLDIYVVNERFGNDPELLGNIMWRNDGSDGAGGWIFTDVTELTGTVHRKNPMGLAIGDYDNDGWLDFAMSDAGPNLLFQNGGGVFTEVAEQAGVDRPLVPGEHYNQVGWGLVFSDFDLDGAEDLYVATGGIGARSSPQPNPLFMNDFNPPDPTFTDVTDISGANDDRRARTVVKGDFDLDGDEDLYVVNYNNLALLCRNDQPGGDYLVLKLTGTRSNRDAIGARVRVQSALGDQYRMVQSGSTTGGSNDLALYYGVSGESQVEVIDIDWPSGSRTVLTDRPVNQRLGVREMAIQLDGGELDLDEYGRLSELTTAVGSHLGDFRLYVAVDGGAPALLGPDDFDVVNPLEVQDQRASSKLLSADGLLEVKLTTELRELSGDRVRVKMSVEIANLSGAAVDVKHYAYYDWNLGGADSDQGKHLSGGKIRQRDPAALPGKNADLRADRPFSHWELDTAPSLLDKLEQAASAIDLADTGGLIEGDVTSAVQFDATIDPAGSWRVVHEFVF